MPRRSASRRSAARVSARTGHCSANTWPQPRRVRRSSRSGRSTGGRRPAATTCTPCCGLDEQRKGGLLGAGVESPRSRPAPPRSTPGSSGQGVGSAGVEPAHALAGLPAAVRPGAQQVGLAAAGRAPQVDRRRGQHSERRCSTAAALAPGRKVSKVGSVSGPMASGICFMAVPAALSAGPDRPGAQFGPGAVAAPGIVAGTGNAPGRPEVAAAARGRPVRHAPGRGRGALPSCRAAARPGARHGQQPGPVLGGAVDLLQVAQQPGDDVARRAPTAGTGPAAPRTRPQATLAR
jgi:hypothetical protein